MARNPPAQNTPSIIYGTMDTLLAVGAQGAFSNRPSAVFGVQRDAKTPKSYNYSVGVQRELGWGTVIDVTYAGFQMRNAEMNSNINTVPDGARFLDLNPQNANPQNPTTAKPAEFLRPYLGYQHITIREHFGTASYNSLQVQLNRRYINGLQFAVAYTFGKTVSDGTNYDTARPGGGAGTRAPTARRSTTTSSINYTWDVPPGSRMWDNWFTRGAARRLAALRRHRVRQRRLGGREHVDDRQLRLHRRRRRHAPRHHAATRSAAAATATRRRAAAAATSTSRRSAGSPGAATSATRRSPSTGCRRSCCRTCRSSRTSSSAAARRIQFRWEAYNVFNQVNWSTLNTNAQFNPAGEQVNASFGQATAARDARVMQGAMRFTF